MPTKKTYLVLFPGAWGNSAPKTIEWWFQAVVAFAKSRFGDDIVVLPMTYDHQADSLSLDDFAKDAHQLLLWKNIPDGDRVIAVGYSMGGQVMRLTAAKWSGHFTDQVIIASSGRRGMRFFGLCRGVWVVLKAFTTSLVTGWIKLTTVEEIHGLFFNKRLMDSVAREHYKIILGHLHPESRWACLRLGVPLIRQRAPALSGKVHMILPEDDVMFRDELDGRCKCGEDWKIIPVRGGHGAILDYEAMEHALHQVDWSD